VGRSASAEAGYKAGVLTHSSRKGAFTGASLNGAELNHNKEDDRGALQQDISFEDILKGKVPAATTGAHDFANAVQNAKVARPKPASS